MTSVSQPGSRLTQGDFDFPGDVLARDSARQLFLAAVRLHVPQVLEELAELLPLHYATFDQCFPDQPIETFTRGAEQGSKKYLLPPVPYSADVLEAIVPWPPPFPRSWPLSVALRPKGTDSMRGLRMLREDLRMFREALWECIFSWRMAEPWCLYAALDHLAYCRFPLMFDVLAWGDTEYLLAYLDSPLVFDVLALGNTEYLKRGPSFSETPPFDYTPPPGWKIWSETERDFTSRLDADYERQKQAYIAKRKMEAMDRGLKPAVIKRDPDHFIWLALYQVGQRSYRAIARQVCREPGTVRDAVVRTAELIDLTLRLPSEPGRKAKTVG